VPRKEKKKKKNLPTLRNEVDMYTRRDDWRESVLFFLFCFFFFRRPPGGLFRAKEVDLFTRVSYITMLMKNEANAFSIFFTTWLLVCLFFFLLLLLLLLLYFCVCVSEWVMFFFFLCCNFSAAARLYSFYYCFERFGCVGRSRLLLPLTSEWNSPAPGGDSSWSNRLRRKKRRRRKKNEPTSISIYLFWMPNSHASFSSARGDSYYKRFVISRAL
jgi:hypothetical protein